MIGDSGGALEKGGHLRRQNEGRSDDEGRIRGGGIVEVRGERWKSLK